VARRCAGLLFACALTVLATGCAQLVPQTVALRSAWPEGVPQTVELTSVPFFPQEDYQCGPAALATVLGASGVSAATPERLVQQVFVPARHGALQLEMIAAPRTYGRVSYPLAPQYSDLLREVAAGNPVVVLQDVGLMSPMVPQWHYAVVNGFDYPSGTIYLRSGRDPRQQMPFTYFERQWKAGGYWAMVVTPPDRIPATATEEGWVNAVIAMSRTAAGSEAAQKGYEAALKRWPNDLPAMIGLANIHNERGDHGRAIGVLRDAQAKHPQSAIVANNLAQALSDSGRHAEALAQIDRMSDPNGPFAAEIKSTRALILQRMAQQRQGNRR
jgi:hypothetical protein